MSDYQTVSFREFVESEETELARVWKENLRLQASQESMHKHIHWLEDELNDLRHELEEKRGKTLCPMCERVVYGDDDE
jgi:predicted RNase H-like nuclease (RuvC/YqgF family)